MKKQPESPRETGDTFVIHAPRDPQTLMEGEKFRTHNEVLETYTWLSAEYRASSKEPRRPFVFSSVQAVGMMVRYFTPEGKRSHTLANAKLWLSTLDERAPAEIETRFWRRAQVFEMTLRDASELNFKTALDFIMEREALECVATILRLINDEMPTRCNEVMKRIDALLRPLEEQITRHSEKLKHAELSFYFRDMAKHLNDWWVPLAAHH